jgi:hypothetical protein
MYKKFLWEVLKGRDYLKDLGIDGRIILKWIFKEIRLEAVDWIHLADRNSWQALVNTVMNILVP